ncbi:AI-2E family transporter [Aminivibrio sp.]|uniref:AI-2E family transporter n=1 Tax=Aminivibrio sp. TaxID=1872489 RepID=UPI001A489E82|nr:AI-2E family transporter [Aminivibrio sp.]MBL3540152.1 AI-2E family transporter [Aminivibrio sp.]
MGNVQIIIGLVSIISIVATGLVLNFAQAVFIPLIIAWLLSYIFGPIVRFLSRLKIPTFINVIVVLAIFFGVCVLGALFLNARILTFTEAFPKYYARLLDIGKSLTVNFDLPPDFWLSINWGVTVRGYLLELSGSFVTIVSKLVMVIVFLVFLLLGAPYFDYKLQKAFSPGTAEKVKRILGTISFQIGRYLSALAFISAVTGFLVWFALEFLQVDFAVTWGLLAFILNFIPTVGSIVASIPPILVALVQFYPSYMPAVVTALVLLTIQVTIGNFITPKVMGDRLNLSPVAVLISLLFWSLIWGVAGALISTIIAAIIKIICENIPSLNFISVMMGSGKVYQKEFEERV